MKTLINILVMVLVVMMIGCGESVTPTEMDPCNGNPCVMGECVEPNLETGEYSCDCDEGYKFDGETCIEIVVDPDCVENSDCGEGEICDDGECVPHVECTVNADCNPSGNTPKTMCDDGKCRCGTYVGGEYVWDVAVWTTDACECDEGQVYRKDKWYACYYE